MTVLLFPTEQPLPSRLGLTSSEYVLELESHMGSGSKSLPGESTVASILFAVLSAFYLYWVGLDRWLLHDNAIYLYSGLQLLEGLRPYESIFDIKTPLTSFVSAAGIGLGSLADIEPVYAARATFALIAASVGNGLYLILRNVRVSKAAASFTALLPITLSPWLLYIASGPRPKVLATALLVWAFYALIRERWFLAGLFTSLAVLTWQPCVLALLAIVGSVVSHRDKGTMGRLGFLLLGAALPATLTVVYFATTGSLEPFLDGSVGIHLGYLRARAQLNPLAGLMAVFKLAHPMWTLLWLGGAVFLIVCLRQTRRTGGPERIFWFSLMAAFLFLSMFSLVDFQSTTDAFVLLPPVLIGIATLIDSWLETLEQSTVYLPAFAFALLVVCLLLTGLLEGLSVRQKWPSIERQRKLVQQIAHEVGATQQAAIVGAPQVLALTEWVNSQPYVIIDSGVDQFIADHHENGFDGWMSHVLCGPEQHIVLGKVIGVLMEERFRPTLRMTHRRVREYSTWMEHSVAVWRRTVDRSTCALIARS